MAIFKCSCGYSKKLDDSQIGKKGKCPKCQTVVTVITNISEEEEKTVTTTTEESAKKNKVPKSSGFFKCPHCNKSISIENLNLGKGDIGSIISKLEKSIKGKFSGVDTEKISETLKEGGKYYLYVLYGILLISVLSVIVLTGGIGNKINNIIYLLVIWSVLFVYVDATHNKIGKIPGKKGMLNNSAGVWSIGTLLLWIVVFPLYLINRKILMEKAQNSPQEVPETRRKIILGMISVVFIAVLFNGVLSGGGNVGLVKNGMLENDGKSFDVAKASEQELMKFMNQTPNIMALNGKQRVDKAREIFKANGYDFSSTLNKLSVNEFPCMQKYGNIAVFVGMFYDPFDLNDTEWVKLEKEGKLNEKLKSAGYSEQESKDLIKLSNRILNMDPLSLPQNCG